MRRFETVCSLKETFCSVNSNKKKVKMVVGNKSDGGQTQESDGGNTICTSSREKSIIVKKSDLVFISSRDKIDNIM